MNCESIKCKCPCCGGDEIVDKFPADNHRTKNTVPSSYVRCALCGSLYVNSPIASITQIKDYDERYRHTYEKLIKKLKRKWYRTFACWIYGLLSGFSHIRFPREGRAGDKLLDIGCGIGLQTKFLKRRGVEVFGIDSSARAIDFAKRINDGEKFTCGDFFESNEKEKFDFIRLDNVIEHIGNFSEFLGKIMTMLKPGGKIIIFTPNADSASLRLLRGKSVSAWPSEHVIIFSRGSLAYLLKKSGFEIKRIYRNTPSWWLAYNFFMLIGVGDKITADSFLLKVMSLFFLPVSYIFNFLRIEEEIVVEAVKPLCLMENSSSF
ncbi:MAG: hypothetical protein DRI44_09745 [Chlamydiae bacterium]|nr:MAG: hypothetical protein DRI44_09745 [Chlamydiota bacterium]